MFPSHVLMQLQTPPSRAALPTHLPELPAPKVRHHPLSFAEMSGCKCGFIPFSHGAQCHRTLPRPKNVKDLKKVQVPETVSVEGRACSSWGTWKQSLGEMKPKHFAFGDSCCLQRFTGTAALEEDAQILKVIEAYCTGAGFQQALSSGGPTTRLFNSSSACNTDNPSGKIQMVASYSNETHARKPCGVQSSR